MTTPECDCKRARHTHGDSVMYVHHKCRCAVCRASRAEAERDRSRAQAYGRYYLTDAEPARQHVRGLMVQGMGWKRVAQAAGVNPSSVGALLYPQGGKDPRPPRKKISKQMEAKLLAVKVDLGHHAVVENTGTVRRLQALAALGWSQSRLASLIGMNPSNFWQLIHGKNKGVLFATAGQVEDIFNARWNQAPEAQTAAERGGITRAKREAATKGWATAAAWDDIDNPDEEPKGNLVDLTVDHRSRPNLEKLDRLELLIRDGHGDNNGTFVRAGWASRMSGWKVLQRMNRLDLVDRLQRNDNVRQIAS